MPAVLQVMKIVAMLVRLALKGYVHVSLLHVAVLDQAHEPLQDIEHIKGQHQQFQLLGRMNLLVVDDMAVYPRTVPRPQGAEEVDTIPLAHESTLYDDWLFQTGWV